MKESRLRYAVLGAVTVFRDGDIVAIDQPRSQAVLVSLLLAEKPVSASELIDAVWGDEAPANAMSALRTHIHSLRTLLEPDRPTRAPATVLTSVGRGYALRAEPDAVDAWRADSLSAQAGQARADGDLEEAHRLVTEALALWRGGPLVGVPGPDAAAHRLRRIEQHITLFSTRLELDVELGRHSQVVGELAALAAEYPLREHLQATLMTALARAGRRSEALDVYTRTRRILVEELGIEPGSRLADIHQRILNDDIGAGPVAPQRPGPMVHPAQLPADLPDFTGREQLLVELRNRVTVQQEQAPTVVAITGMGGLGKTALAVHLAHELCAQFPDGQLYADLAGAGERPVEPGAVLGGWLRALGIDKSHIPADDQQRAALLRTTIADRRVLLVLDNARDTDQLRSLLPGTSGCAVLVTSRTNLTGLPGAHHVGLDVLTPREARALVERILTPERVAAEPRATADLIAACGYLPLAVRIVAARLATRPTWTIASVLARLADDDRRLTELKLGTIAVATTFDFSYRQLESELARAFVLLAVPEVPSLSVPAAAAILGLDRRAAERLCETLVDLGMLQTPSPGRYHHHDLLRLFALRQTDDERSEAIPRLLDFYLATVRNIWQSCDPAASLDGLATSADPGDRIDGQAALTEWLNTERSNIIAVHRHVAADYPGLVAASVDLALMIVRLVDYSHQAPQVIAALAELADAAHAGGDPIAENRARLVHGHIRMLTGETVTVVADIHTCARALGELGDKHTLAVAEYVLATIETRLAHINEAIIHYQASIDISAAHADIWGEATAWCALARTCNFAQRNDEAARAAERAIALARSIEAAPIEAVSLSELGMALLQRDGDTVAARAHCEHGVEVARRTGRKFNEGWALARLSGILLAIPDAEAALVTADEAVQAWTEVGEPTGITFALVAYQKALDLLGRKDEAAEVAAQLAQLRDRLGGVPLADAVSEAIEDHARTVARNTRMSSASGTSSAT